VSTRGAHLRAAEGAPPGNMAHVDITPPGTATPPSLVPDTVFFKSHNHSTYLHSTYLVSPASASSAHDSHPTMDPLHIYILSDSSGETAAHIIKAAVAQFPSRSVCVHRLAPVTHSRQIHELLANIIHRPALIAYTFVVPELQETLVNAALTTDDLHLIDLIGPLIESVAHHTNKIPLHQPRRRHVLDSAYFQRMEAVNFSVQFDDGKVHDALHRADVVLVGLSRTSKTPSCMYLAQHYSLKAANIPLVPGTDVPKAIYSVDPQRIIGLTINADHLYSLRLHRAQHMGLSVRTDYSNYDSIREEMQYATSFFREVGCQVINVTNRAIEETAAEIVRRLENAGCLLFLTETG
jgi:regulator of PEP synthase PpsR (kinase-PPPase family)